MTKSLTIPTTDYKCTFFIETTKDNKICFSFDGPTGVFKKKDIVKIIKFLQDSLKE